MSQWSERLSYKHDRHEVRDAVNRSASSSSFARERDQRISGCSTLHIVNLIGAETMKYEKYNAMRSTAFFLTNTLPVSYAIQKVELKQSVKFTLTVGE